MKKKFIKVKRLFKEHDYVDVEEILSKKLGVRIKRKGDWEYGDYYYFKHGRKIAYEIWEESNGKVNCYIREDYLYLFKEAERLATEEEKNMPEEEKKMYDLFCMAVDKMFEKVSKEGI